MCVCVHMFLCVREGSCTLECMCMYMYMCMWKLDVKFECYSSDTIHTPHFETGFLIGSELTKEPRLAGQ